MLIFIKDIFTPPVFEDESKTQQAYLLHMIVWGLVIVPIPYVLFTIFAEPEELLRVLAQALFGEGVNFFLLLLLRRGAVRAASYIQVIMFWLFFTVTAFSGDGVRGEAYTLGYSLTIIIAGVLLGGRAAFMVTLFSLLSGGGMVIAAENGWFQKSSDFPSATWVISLLVFPMGAILQYLSTRTVQSALQRARRSEEKYKLISSVISDYTFATDVNAQGEMKLISVGGAFEALTGYTYEEYVESGGWVAHLHPDDMEQDAQDMRMLFSNCKVETEIRTFTKSGELHWVHSYAHPIWNEKENRLAGIVGAVQDVTGVKLAEEKIKETLLQQSAILNGIPDMAWLKDKNNHYIAVNEQFAKTAGMMIESIIGKSDFDIWRESYANIYSRDHIEVMQTGKRKHTEDIQVDGSGREYWVETIKTPIKNANGDVIGTTGIAREITERKHAEFERENLIAELEAKNAELERFTYTVSHDLKSPLVTITGFLSYLEKDARKGDFQKLKQDMDRIQQAVSKMQTLLKDLLELSRIGRIMNSPAEIHFENIAKDALDLVRGQIEEKHVRVEADVIPVIVHGDQARLIEALQNLVDNAVKFMGDQPDPCIQISSLRNEKNETVFFVRDNGIGIETQYHERIFGLFNKLNPEVDGTGIGLTLVKRIIEVHGGRIWLESEIGRGTTFYFVLP